MWGDLRTLTSDGELDYFFKEPSYDKSLIPGKGGSPETAIKHLNALRKILEEVSDGEFAKPNSVKSSVWEYAEKEGTGAVLWPFRYALTGLARSPDPFFVASVLGKQTSIRRLAAAAASLKI